MNPALMNNYARQDVSFTRGEGVWLWDSEGKRYLDAISGVAVCGLGHAHPAISKVLCEQGATLVHTSNIYRIPMQEALGEKLCALSAMEQAFFCNSGAEANEAAIKLARLYGHNKGIEKPAVIVMEGSFHGRTLATLSATGNRKIQKGFEPLVQGFVRAPYDDLHAVEKIAANNSNIVAILVEPITGEGGIRVPDAAYLAGLRALCDQHDWLLMLDEIQTGMGRTGQWFAFEHSPISPDVITLAKGLGNGIPIGACLARGIAGQTLTPGSHGSTFGGNPLTCRVALEVIRLIEQDRLWEKAAATGATLKQGFIERLADLPGITEIRGKGLMLGIELDRPCAELVQAGLQDGILINVTANNVVRLLPPLITDAEQTEQILTKVSALIRRFVQP